MTESRPQPPRAAEADPEELEGGAGVRTRRARLGCLLIVVAMLALPPLVAFVWWQVATEESILAEAVGDGWVAFLRRVDYAFPADADTSLWLVRTSTRKDRCTWHRLTPTDSVREASLMCTGPGRLVVDVAGDPPTGRVEQIADVVIEWR